MTFLHQRWIKFYFLVQRILFCRCKTKQGCFPWEILGTRFCMHLTHVCCMHVFQFRWPKFLSGPPRGSVPGVSHGLVLQRLRRAEKGIRGAERMFAQQGRQLEHQQIAIARLARRLQDVERQLH